jgi:hypothetical protein
MGDRAALGRCGEDLRRGECVFIVWLVLTLILMLRYNYTYAASASATWPAALTRRLAAPSERERDRGGDVQRVRRSVVLAPVGFFMAPGRLQRLTLVSLPIAALFAYVQQPDRALWNVHF